MNNNMKFYRKLPIPMEIKELYPVSPELAKMREEQIAEMGRILRGESDKFLLIIGPCSADAEAPVLEYASRLRRVQEKVADKLMLVPRVYTGKPRTTGEGYKGMLHQPVSNEHADLLRGLLTIRDLFIKTLSETGFAPADEMLYPENYRYLSDLLS